MVASIKHVSHHVLGTEGDEYTPWSWPPPAHQHKPPHPTTNTKSTQPLSTYHCGQKHSTGTTGIVGSGHRIYRDRMTKCQPTCRKGCLEMQLMEMTLISLIPRTWVLFGQLRAIHLMKHLREKLTPNAIIFHFLHKSDSKNDQWMLLVYNELTNAPIKIPFHFQSHLHLPDKKKKPEVASQQTYKTSSDLKLILNTAKMNGSTSTPEMIKK